MVKLDKCKPLWPSLSEGDIFMSLYLTSNAKTLLNGEPGTDVRPTCAQPILGSRSFQQVHAGTGLWTHDLAPNVGLWQATSSERSVKKVFFIVAESSNSLSWYISVIQCNVLHAMITMILFYLIK